MSVICGPPTLIRGRPDTLTNPTVLIGVLSEATREYDRGEKLVAYQGIPTLREVVLVDQDGGVRVERVYREEGGAWLREEATRLDAVVQLTSIGVGLALGEVFSEAGHGHSPHKGPS